MASAPVTNPTPAPTYNTNSAVVQLTETIGGTVYTASGVLIAPDEVLTSSHFLSLWTGRDEAPGTQADNIVVSSQYAHSAINGLASHWNNFPDTGALRQQDIRDDFGLVKLSIPMNYATPMAYGPAPSGDFSANVSGWPHGTLQNTPENIIHNPQSLGELLGTDIGETGGPVWLGSADGTPTVVALASQSGPPGSANTIPGLTGDFTELTTADCSLIASWIAADHPVPTVPVSIIPATGPPVVAITDTTTGVSTQSPGTPYTGPVSGLDWQMINLTPDNINVSAMVPNMFLHSGAGNDALAVASGTNVLDGGSGSNFLVGGTGLDTFFTDARSLTAPVWSTVVGFHPGDAATLFGPGAELSWANAQGAPGYTGLTLHSGSGPTSASLTLAGYSTADLAPGGRLAVSSGLTGDAPYIYIHGS